MVSLLRINRVIQSDIPVLLFDLFHTGKVSVGGQVLWLNEPALPVPVKRSDHIEWQFSKPVKVETPGPNSQISVVRQYRDRIEFEVWPWAQITLRVQQ
jgi:hypothetical protein